MMITFSAFRTAINTLVFPDGQAETRVPLFRNFIVNGLIQMQTFCESLQLVNVNFYDKDQSWDDCGLSIIQGCRGRIGAVYAFKPSCRCQRFFYDSASLEKLSCFYEHCQCHQAGTCGCGHSVFTSPSLYSANPYYCGDYVGGNTGCRPPYLANEPEDDCAFRLSDKYFAVGPNQKIWLFPRFPCGYILGVHWRGIRRSYLDNDYVPDDDDLKDAVAVYVESEIARRVDKDQATADKLYAEYRMKAGDIIFREEQDLKPRCTRICVEGLDLSELVQIYPDNPYPTNIGESCATSSASVPVELSTPVLDLSISSTPGNTIITWTRGTAPETNEVWRSVNGGAFALIASIAGSLTTYADTSPMADNDVWCYKVRGVTDEIDSGFSNQGCAVKNKYVLGTVISEPTWILAYGDLGFDNPPAVTSASFPALKRVYGNLVMDTTAVLSSLNLASLVSIGGDFALSLTSLAALSLPVLATIGGGLLAAISANLASVSAPALVSVGLDVEFDDCALTTVSIPSLVLHNGRTYAFDTNVLTAASVAHILARGVASSVTSAIIHLDSGNAGLASLSAQGQADYGILVGQGNTISINP